MSLRILFATCLLFGTASAEEPWITASNEHARVLIEVMARNAPEEAAPLGVEGHDEDIVDLTPGYEERARERLRAALKELHQRQSAETDPKVRQDLSILIQSAALDIRESELDQKLMLGYSSVSRRIFFSLRGLLDDRIASERRKAALVRLRRYTGIEDGYEPIATLVERRLRERLKDPALVAPFRRQVERDLTETPFLLQGLAPMFDKHGINGFEEPLEALKAQVAAYEKFVREQIVPGARDDFRLPRELYAVSLERYGVNLPPEALANQARGAFRTLQVEMQEIAAKIAEERGWASSDYRDVIRELKRDRIVGADILPHYRKRLAQIEEMVRREKIVTLPERAARIRLASPAESAAMPAPHMSPPRLLGNTGEQGEFVLPLRTPDASGNLSEMDDFTNASASWPLTAHEARPGHEMQFASIVETGVSTARAVFAFNSTNVEGWGLYSEAIVKPFMPPDGQLMVLWSRLMRVTRAFLDPELQLGRITIDEARRVLEGEVVLSTPLATQELDRYTFRAPGQATSYYYGYSRLMSLRLDLQKRLGARFDQMRFHDFVLAEGLLPPDLLRQAVSEEFGL